MIRPVITLRALRHPRRLKRLKEWLHGGVTVDLIDHGEIIGEFISLVGRDSKVKEAEGQKRAERLRIEE